MSRTAIQVVPMIGVTFFCSFCIYVCWLNPVLCWVNIDHRIVTFLINRCNTGDHGWLWFWLWILLSTDNILVVMSASIWFKQISLFLFSLSLLTMLMSLANISFIFNLFIFISNVFLIFPYSLVIVRLYVPFEWIYWICFHSFRDTFAEYINI